jgi:hypothetical protein
MLSELKLCIYSALHPTICAFTPSPYRVNSQPRSTIASLAPHDTLKLRMHNQQLQYTPCFPRSPEVPHGTDQSGKENSEMYYLPVHDNTHSSTANNHTNYPTANNNAHYQVAIQHGLLNMYHQTLNSCACSTFIRRAPYSRCTSHRQHQAPHNTHRHPEIPWSFHIKATVERCPQFCTFHSLLYT